MRLPEIKYQISFEPMNTEKIENLLKSTKPLTVQFSNKNTHTHTHTHTH